MAVAKLAEPPFNKLLVANRGEIAVRVIRACREEGVRTVAVYSEADTRSLHRLLADESVLVGGLHPSQSYLNVERIVEAALETEAEAIHPGYGFLAEDPEFAERLEREGIAFVGPPSRVLRLVGNKVEAERIASSTGVPVVPGSPGPVEPEEALDVAENLGYPVVVKPVWGGGGIGICVVRDELELEGVLEKASKIAGSTFARGEVYLEKHLPKARHVEVQVLADSKGHVIHLYERECSIQRRFQKLVEEAPSPALGEDERERLCELALRVAKAVGYVNAGTIEFLYAPDEREFYFIEVNPRIQVEHPVTEAVTGIDIVKQQMRIAAGGELGLDQEDVELRGHAVECRICAEDPLNGFKPSPGVVKLFHPPGGPGVRVDAGIYSGCEVPPFYDPLIFKVITWGSTRREAVWRMRRALEETVVEGISTNVILHEVVMRDEKFVEGDVSTTFLEEREIIKKIRRYERERKLEISAPRERAREREAPVDLWKLTSRLGL